MRFIATLKRNMEKAMRHVRPPITFTPIIIYKGCHMAVYRSSPHPSRRHGDGEGVDARLFVACRRLEIFNAG